MLSVFNVPCPEGDLVSFQDCKEKTVSDKIRGVTGLSEEEERDLIVTTAG